MRELLKSESGITPVMSNLLLLVIAVAAMSIATTATYVITGNLHDTMGERFILEDVWFRNNQISVYLRNVGKITIRISAVYLNSTPHSFTSCELEPGEHGWLNITHSWQAGSVYRINILTERGTRAAEYHRAPLAG